MVAAVSFAKQVRQMSGWLRGGGAAHGGHHHHHNNPDSESGPDETTPLNGRARRSSDSSQRHGPAWVRFLCDAHRTPGDDDERILVRAAANTWHVIKISLLSSPVNVLIFFVPVGLAAGILGWSPTWIFTLNFLAIIPLAAILSFATEEISVKLGETVGGLVNATFGNAVELIVSVIALRQGQIEVVQASMLGSILSNLLLVMGMCFLLGGVANMRTSDGEGQEQEFSSGTAQTTSSLMTLSAASMIIPATLYGVLDGNDADPKEKEQSILVLSRGTSIILLMLYCLYLWFQLNTHKNLFISKAETERANSVNGSASPNGINSTTSTVVSDEEAQSSVGGEEDDETHMLWWAAALVLVGTTVVISFCADYLVESIEPIVETGILSRAFIGLILIPIVGNAAEHVTACVVAVRNKMDLALGVAIGSSIQIALLVTPALVITGWLILDQPMSLRFETFQTVAFALSVLVVTFTVNDGKSNYLEGAMLLGLYIIIALAFYASPTNGLDGVPSFHKAVSTIVGSSS
ncbi:vacuolar calcium ion transporter [Magnaporthiopsis poae ATCC 64411]|uniref:Vacuolar calcium ion transporter n=1 Tax=Magnaporthiopsis poae (strain ATCC 64411 / 73-15) TaxID=644358 RepID=A0A0C4EEC3_MAGP6|nr:vacuolar calcium ion transporter [Magnaporthiopsis poae ATCC 64411]